MYHRISATEDPISVPPRRFIEQMEHLAREDCEVVTLSEGFKKRASPGIRVALTFDDGYQDVVETALPVLRRLGFPATMYIVTGTLNGEVPFTWYSQPPPVLTSQDIVALDKEGILEFQAHTITHPNLVALPVDRAKAEIFDSKQALEELLGRAVPGFSYPGGLFGDRERNLVAEANYQYAVTCEPGINTGQEGQFDLMRTPIEFRDTMLDFRSKLAGAHDGYLPLQKQVRRWRYGA